MNIYLHRDYLAETNEPNVDISDGSAFWSPGPERFYGYALRDLRDYLQKITQSKYQLLVFDNDTKDGIYAGTFHQFINFKTYHNDVEKAITSTDAEAFVIEVQGEKLYILGKTFFGLIAGIYTFLDRLGCKWFAPGQHWENVPQLNGLTLSSRLNFSSIGASYKSRHFFSSWGVNSSVVKKGEREKDYTLWCLRNRMGGNGYIANYHNPEIIPQGLSRCNSKAVAAATSTAVEYLKSNKKKGSYYNSFSVEPQDGVAPEPECIKKYGNATNLYFWFANEVAKGIEKAGLKNEWIGLLSYTDHAGIPDFDLHPQVGVQVTSGLQFSNLTVEQRLNGLRRRKAMNLGVYDYANFVGWSKEMPGWQPTSDALFFAANLKRWYENGARTLMAETSDSWVNSGAGHYLAARVMWDINRDPLKELDAYWKGAFSAGATEIRELNADWSKTWSSGKRSKFNRGNLAKWHNLISTADQKVTGQYKVRINEIKRYYLYLNLVRELDIDLHPTLVSSKAERYQRILRFAASNRGTGAFHALGLVLIMLSEVTNPVYSTPISEQQLDKAFQDIVKYNWDKEAWKKFPPINNAEVDAMFEAMKLPLNGNSYHPAVLDPTIRLFPTNASAPSFIKFPKLHGIPGGTPRQYVLKVVRLTTKLTFVIIADNAAGNGEENRTCTITDETGRELKKLAFKINTPVTFELATIKPGIYTVSFPDFGSEQLTVFGMNTFGAVKMVQDTWGFNPFRPVDLKIGENYKAYFAIAAEQNLLRITLAAGRVSIGDKDGKILAKDISKSTEIRISASDKMRIGYVEWQGEYPVTQGLIIEGVTMYSPGPSYVLYESLEKQNEK